MAFNSTQIWKQFGKCVSVYQQQQQMKKKELIFETDNLYHFCIGLYMPKLVGCSKIEKFIQILVIIRC